MTAATRLQDISGSSIKTLVGLSDDQVKVFVDDYQVKTIQNLKLLDPVSVDMMLGNERASFLVCKRLVAVIKYLNDSGTIASSTTMGDVLKHRAPSPAPAANPAPATKAVSAAPIKLNTTDFPKFTGEVDNQETCKELAESKIGQTAFKFLHEMKNFLMSTNLHFIEAKHVI